MGAQYRSDKCQEAKAKDLFQNFYGNDSCLDMPSIWVLLAFQSCTQFDGRATVMEHQIYVKASLLSHPMA